MIVRKIIKLDFNPVDRSSKLVLIVKFSFTKVLSIELIHFSSFFLFYILIVFAKNYFIVFLLI